MKKTITHFIVLGDSASDIGITNSRSQIVRKFAGLINASPLGRFSNARVWVDFLASQLGHQLSIQQLKKTYNITSSDIADGIIHNDKKITPFISNLTYKECKEIYFKNNLFFRNYSEGGVTAVNYKWKLVDPYRFIYRLTVPCLEQKVVQALQDDQKNSVTTKTKNETLIIEFISSNDILQAKTNFEHQKTQEIVDARLKNAEKLIKQGYRNFIFFNAIDLSLTPRYFNKPNAKLAKKFCKKLNEVFNRSLEKIKLKYPSCSFDIYDVNALFNEIYTNPTKFNYDKSKIHTSFKDSSDFKPVPLKQSSHARGYLFWDTVHPSDSLHFYLAEGLHLLILEKYHVNFLSDLPVLQKTIRK